MKFRILFVVILICAAIFSVIQYENNLKIEKVEYLSKEVDSFEVVVARYNEDLSWIEKEFSNDKVTIYNKGKDDLKLPAKYKIVNIPNVGREANTYLYHIVHNYKNIADRTLFMQGNPCDGKCNNKGGAYYVFSPFSQYKKIAKTACRSIIAAHCHLLDEVTINNVLSNLKDTKWNDTIYKNYDFIGFKKQFIDSDFKSEQSFYTSYGANFAIDKCKVWQHNIQYYLNILNTLDNIAPIEGHYMERLWDEMLSKNLQACSK